MDTATITPSSPTEVGTTSTQPYRLRWVVAAVVLAANLMDESAGGWMKRLLQPRRRRGPFGR